MNRILVQPQVLREYAVLADGQRGALVGPRGEIVWMCAPRWDSAGVFSALVGGQGEYVLTPGDPWYVWGGYYEEGSLIWRSRWVTAQGAVEVREALSLPGDEHTAVLLRRIEALDREANIKVRLNPRAEFGRKAMRSVRHDGDTWTARVGDLHLRLAGAPEGAVEHGALGFELSLPAGATHDLVLEISDLPLGREPVDPTHAWQATAEQWRERVPDLDSSVGGRDVRHAYAVLSGLTASTGGMVAAATTSLPERARAGRNYDYRYCWIRDQCYAGRAVAFDGPHPLMDSAIRFVSERLLEDGAALRPAYTIDGGRVPPEHEIPQLTGYPGGGNCIGNRIDSQFQLDTFGESLLLFASGGRYDHLDASHWRAIETAVAAIVERGDEPGAGIWEIDDQHWTHSRLICAAGLRAVAALAPQPQSASWASLADQIVARTTKDSVHPSGRWQRSPGDPGVDAALLLPALRGAVPANDPRTRATLEAVLDDLVHDGYVYRFRHDARPLDKAEGAFQLCGFLVALALQQQGREVDARAFFERSRAACGPPGLFSEEYDVNQRQLRGNLPQAFVHALMLEASVRLARPWQDEQALAARG